MADYFPAVPAPFLDAYDPEPVRQRRRRVSDQRIVDAEIPGTIPGLAGTTLYDVPLSARERETNARLAREEAAAEGVDSTVRTPEMIRELGDIASMYGVPGLERAADAVADSGTLRSLAAVAVPGLAPMLAADEYDPVALASAFNPLTDEAFGAIEAARGGSYRAAQSAAEQRFEQAQERSPGSAMVGALGSMATLGPAMEGAGALRLGAAGGALGTAGGILGSEGESWGRRLYEGGRAGLIGTGLGLTAGRLNALGAGMRAAAPSSFGNAIARSAIGTGIESAGQGVALGALGSGGRMTDPLYEGGRFSEMLTDPAVGGAAGAVGGTALGVPAGIARGVRLARTPRNVPGLAADTTGEIDETAQEIGQYLDDEGDDIAAAVPSGGLAEFDPRAVIRARPAPERSAAETVLGVSMEDPSIATIKAAGGMDRAVQRQAARVFGGGQAGLDRAAATASEAGIFTPGEVTTLGETVRRAEIVRDAARADLAARHAAVAERGGVIPGNQVSDALEAEAARLEAPGRHALPGPIRNRIDDLRTRANEIRYGTTTATEDLGRTARRIERAPTLDPEDVIDDAADDVPGLTGYSVPESLRRMTRPAIYPYQSGRQIMGNVAGLARTFAPGQAPAPGTTRELLQTEYGAWVPARNRAAERALSPSEYESMRRANRTYRLAETLAPSDSIASARLRSEGLLRASLARASGGPFAFLRGLAERSYAQHEPSVQAALASGIVPSTPGQRAFAGRLGNYADRLTAPGEFAAGLPAAAGAALVGAGEPRRVEDARLTVAARPAAAARLRSVESLGWDQFAGEDDQNAPADDMGWGDIAPVEDDDQTERPTR